MIPLWLAGLVPLDPGSPRLDPDTQHTRAAAPDITAFRRRWGPWRVRFDPIDGSPRMITGATSPAARLDALLADVASLAGVQPADLVRGEPRAVGPLRVLHLQRRWRGHPVPDDGVDVYLRDDQVVGLRVALRSFTAPAGHPPEGGFVAIEASPSGYQARWAQQLVIDGGAVWVGSDDETLLQLLDRFEARPTPTLRPLERGPDGPQLEVPAQGFPVSVERRRRASGTSGRLPGAPGAVLELADARVQVQRADGSPYRVPIDRAGVGGGVGVHTVVHHTLATRAWLESVDATHPWLARPTTVQPDGLGPTCEARWDAGVVKLGAGAEGCRPPNQFADLIRHELGHGIYAAGLVGGRPSVVMTEALADYTAAAGSGDPQIAPGFRGDEPLRDLRTAAATPGSTPHAQGARVAGFGWSARRAAEARASQIGQRRSDRWFIDLLRLGPSPEDLPELALLVDDDDATLGNGTPRACELLQLLDASGAGGSRPGWSLLEHEPPAQLPSAAEHVGIAFRLTPTLPGCGAPRAPGVVTLDADDEPTGTFPVRTAGEHHLALLPPEPAGASVRYRVRWNEAGVERRTLPFTAQVGDTEPLRCGPVGAGGRWPADGSALTLDAPGARSILRAELDAAAPVRSVRWLPEGELLWSAATASPADLLSPLSVDLRALVGRRGSLQLDGVPAGRQLCVLTLADPDAHYTVRDVRLDWERGVPTLRWTTPRVTPIGHATVWALDTAPADGAPAPATPPLARLPTPTPGAPAALDLSEPLAPYYLVMTGPTDDPLGTIEEGHNLLTTPPPPDTGAPLDTGDTGWTDTGWADTGPLPGGALGATQRGADPAAAATARRASRRRAAARQRTASGTVLRTAGGAAALLCLVPLLLRRRPW